MDQAAQKEQFSHAYVRAVASAAGCAVDRVEVDRESVDLTLKNHDASGPVAFPRLDLQLKCSFRELLREDALHFPLKRKNYDDLRTGNLLVPRILVVVLVPADAGSWLVQSEEEMLVRHCGYWRSLKGLPETSNETSVTVEIPRSSLFDVAALGGMMRQISLGEGL